MSVNSLILFPLKDEAEVLGPPCLGGLCLLVAAALLIDGGMKSVPVASGLESTVLSLEAEELSQNYGQYTGSR